MMDRKLLDNLIGLIEGEPDDVSLEKMAQEGFIKLHKEPEHSRSVLMKFQRKYCVHSVDILNEGYRLASRVSVSDHDFSEWLWAIEQFIKAGGILFDLPFSDEDVWITHPTIGTSPARQRENPVRHDLFALVAFAA